MSKGLIFLTPEQAIAMLPERIEIHTYTSNDLVGTYLNRENVIELIESGAQCELSGPLATQMGYGLVVMHETGPLFVQTREGSA